MGFTSYSHDLLPSIYLLPSFVLFLVPLFLVSFLFLIFHFLFSIFSLFLSFHLWFWFLCSVFLFHCICFSLCPYICFCLYLDLDLSVIFNMCLFILYSIICVICRRKKRSNSGHPTIRYPTFGVGRYAPLAIRD